MPKWIIGYGYKPEVAVGTFVSKADAVLHARDLAVAIGVPYDDLDDHAWARPYDSQLAREWGLVGYDEQDIPGLIWKAGAPWR